MSGSSGGRKPTRSKQTKTSACTWASTQCLASWELYVLVFVLGEHSSVSYLSWFRLTRPRFAFISIVSNSAARLHSDLLETTLKYALASNDMHMEKEVLQFARATFRYFTATDSGELLNRFSQDMELIDMELPIDMVNYTSGTPRLPHTPLESLIEP
jgi:ABC-type multidrug transport system fused ATPase/permease subunit